MTRAEALKKIAEGIDALIEMEEAGAPAPTTEKKAAKGKKEAAPKVEPEEVEAEQKDVVKLEDMEFNELKAMAKDLGCKAVGTKAQLIKNIKKALAEQEEADEQADDEQNDEGAEVESDDADNDGGEELDEDEVKAKLDEAFAGYTDAELRDFLKQLGVSTKGSRDVLMSKIYDHADEIDLGESDDDEGGAEDDEDVNTIEEDDSADNEIGEGDDDSDDEQEEEDSEEMTEARAKAIEEFEAEQRDAFENGELDVQEMKDFLKENYDIDLGKKVKPQEVLEKYIEKAVNFIDDEGNTVEQGVYVVNGENYCCGNPLKITKNKKGELTATCAICGEKYEFDEDE